MNYDTNIDFNEYISNLAKLSESIQIGEVTVLTGPNSSGKSLMRKSLQLFMNEKEESLKVSSISMERRTNSNPEYGALSGMALDTPWIATSMNTFKLTKGLFSQKDKFWVIDEPEIGLSQELLLGIINYINKFVAECREEGTFKGLLIITHEPMVVKEILSDKFINIEGYDKDGWLNREVIAQDPDEVYEFGVKLMQAVQAMQNK